MCWERVRVPRGELVKHTVRGCDWVSAGLVEKHTRAERYGGGVWKPSCKPALAHTHNTTQRAEALSGAYLLDG